MYLLRAVHYATRMASTHSCPSYELAVEKLVSLQSISSVVTTAEKERQTNRFSVRNRNVEVTGLYLKRLGITPADLKSLNVIHVAGTKGKGSTCALTESIMRHSGYSTGFCSSPHLMEIRERIRLNGQVISRELFGHYFHEIWDLFSHCDIAKETESLSRYPSFIKFLVVMSYYVFLKEKVDVAVIEVGLGGRYDCTNIVLEPVVTAITHLGYDHCSILGNTVSEIAREKAGIMKDGIPVLTVPQHYQESVPVLLDEASSHATNLITVPPLTEYPNPPSTSVASETWAKNVSLALQIARTWIAAQHPNDTNAYLESIKNGTAAPFLIPELFLEGVEACQWPGRNHIVRRGDVSYYLDGAHTPVSIAMCSKWFTECIRTSSRLRRVLIANTTRDRQMGDFLGIIKKEVVFDLVIFCPNIASNQYVVKDCEWPDDIKSGMVKRAEENKINWSQMCPDIPAVSFSSVEDAIHHIESIDLKTDVLVTGSLHLVGAALQVLQPHFLDDQLRSYQHIRNV